MATSTLTPTRESSTIVVERHFEPRELPYVMQLIHEGRLTGTLSIDMHQGAAGTIRFIENKKIPSPQ